MHFISVSALRLILKAWLPRQPERVWAERMLGLIHFQSVQRLLFQAPPLRCMRVFLMTFNLSCFFNVTGSINNMLESLYQTCSVKTAAPINTDSCLRHGIARTATAKILDLYVTWRSFTWWNLTVFRSAGWAPSDAQAASKCMIIYLTLSCWSLPFELYSITAVKGPRAQTPQHALMTFTDVLGSISWEKSLRVRFWFWCKTEPLDQGTFRNQIISLRIRWRNKIRI